MFSQTTRLELAIAVAVLTVLFLCSQPPKPGTAGVHRDEEGPKIGTPDRESSVPLSLPAFTPSQVPAGSVPQGTSSSPAVALPGSRAMPDNLPAYLPIPPRPRTKRIGMVDARNCPGLNYPDVMYGEVTVQWVWDGQRDVLRKVVEVREANGAISTWEFDNKNGVIVSELEP